MTPTPEDIRLAVEIEERAWCPGHLDIDETGKLIAAHTAPLRELAEIGRLAVEKKQRGHVEPLAVWVEREIAFSKAVKAYLAKQEESR